MKPAFSLLLIALLCCLALSAAAQSSGTEAAYVPERVYHSGTKKFSDFEALLADVASADVVFVGEQHDDPNTHRLERALLEGLLHRRAGRQQPNIIVAMEMFERDVQPILDDYLAGKISEAEFLKQARPWPRYQTDYRAIVEFARVHGWRVIASNAPRPLARKVSQEGLAAVDKLTPEERQNIARQNNCPLDDYYRRFAETMSNHPGATADNDKKQPSKEAEAANRAIIEKFYYAQCIKDETMGESVAQAYSQSSAARPLVIHYNGAFHSDHRLGTAARTQQRLPRANVKVISIVPLDNLDNIKPEEYRKRGDYIVFTLKTAPAKNASQPAPSAGR